MKVSVSIIISLMIIMIASSSFTCQPDVNNKFDDLKALFSDAPSGVDYIMNLYDSVDVVVLGERDHRDTTQYDFINRLISDPRFIEKVGYVYTEVGTVNTAPICERTVTADYKDYSEFRDSALSQIRIEDFYSIWEKYNRYQLLENLYRLNSTLPKDKRVILRGTDLAFDWKDYNDVESYRKFLNEEVNGGNRRDSAMADNFLKMFKAQPERGGYHKALLITNAPHAIKDPLYFNEGYIISRDLGDNVRTVLMNWTEWWRHGDEVLRPWLGGIPDSAYVASGRLDLGFNLAESPIGDADFCNSTDYKVSDYADGMIYYLDPRRFVLTIGVPGVVSEEFLPELVRRSIISDKSMGRTETMTPNQLANFYNIKRMFNPYAEAWMYGEYEIPEVVGLDMEVKDAAIKILKAISASDHSVYELVGIEDGDMSDGLLGMEIVSTGEMIPYADGEGMSVLCELKLKNGSILKRKIYLRKNYSGRWYFDGGI